MHRLIVLSLTMAGLATLLQADAWNKKTQLTVNETIEVPGATLTPGKYVVKLVDSQSNRHIVQFTNESGDRVISTVLAIPNQRLRPTGETEFSFYESNAGEGPVLRAWFYPGDNFGQEFAYPERRAQELSKVSGEQVPVAPENIGSTDASQERVTEAREQAPAAETPGSTTAARTQPAVPPQPAERADRPDPALLAQAQPTSTPRETPAAQQPSETPAAAEADESELPATASPAPLLGLLGFLSLGAALGLHRLGKRMLR
jgi:hypothetical protein